MDKNIIAIIGSREPTETQVNKITSILKALNPDTDLIVSGCAYGTDAIALEMAHTMGFETAGILPWDSYNKDVQQFCSVVHVFTDFASHIIAEGRRMVMEHHPAPHRLTQGAMKLHMRNYGIVRWATHVYAMPSNKTGGGGTGQGIRIAEFLRIQTTIIEPDRRW